MFAFLILLLIFISTTKCFTPNCVSENQFRTFSFPVEACSNNFKDKCKFHPKGYFKSLGDVPLVKIGETAVVPTCAFYNADSLECIYGVNSKIEVLATRAFVNLANVKSIHLQFNRIRDVRNDVFKNVSAELLDLSWNNIVFIDSYAFKEINDLKFLNLSRNSLLTLSVNNLAKTLNSINLTYNLLESFALNSGSFINLTSVDVSNNRINKVAISFKYPAEKIDLTNNRIQNFDYMDISSVKKFKMGTNLFEESPQYLENINVEEIDIYPNPWKCENLFILWETLVSFNIRLAPKEKGKNPPAECSEADSRLVTVTRSTECLDDHDCPAYMTCRAKKCWDPCEQSLCHTSNICETKSHIVNCSCPIGLLANPLDIYAECKKVECFADKDCGIFSHCLNEICSPDGQPAYAPIYINLQPTRPTVSPSMPPHYSTTTRRYYDYPVIFATESPSMPPHYSTTTRRYYDIPATFATESPSMPPHYSTTPRRYYDIPSTFVTRPTYTTTTQSNQDEELPWWFDEIPNVAPPKPRPRKQFTPHS